MDSSIIHIRRFGSDSSSDLDKKQCYPYPIHIRATVFEFYSNSIKFYFSDLIGFGYDAYPLDRVDFVTLRSYHHIINYFFILLLKFLILIY